MKTKLLACLLLVAFVSGCTTAGRYALLDLDLRTQDQVKAFEKEAAIPYTAEQAKAAQPQVQAQVVDVSLWMKILDVLSVLKGRIRIFSVEWAGEK